MSCITIATVTIGLHIAHRSRGLVERVTAAGEADTRGVRVGDALVSIGKYRCWDQSASGEIKRGCDVVGMVKAARKEGAELKIIFDRPQPTSAPTTAVPTNAPRARAAQPKTDGGKVASNFEKGMSKASCKI